MGGSGAGEELVFVGPPAEWPTLVELALRRIARSVPTWAFVPTAPVPPFLAEKLLHMMYKEGTLTVESLALFEPCDLRDAVLPRCKMVTNTFLASLARHSALTTLDVSHTAVTDAGLECVAAFHALHTLCVSGCTRVSEEGLSWLRGREHLTTLRAAGCRMSGEQPDLWSSWPSLQRLDVSHNEALNDACFAQLPAGLVELRVAGTSITDEAAAMAWSALGALEVLDVSWTLAGDTCLFLWASSMCKLRVLHMGTSHPTDAGCAFVAEFPALEEWDCSFVHTVSRACILDVVRRAPKLRAVNACDSGLTCGDVLELLSSERLESIDITCAQQGSGRDESAAAPPSNGKLRSVNVRSFAAASCVPLVECLALHPLRALDLSSCAVDDEALAHVAACLPLLEELVISNTSVTCVGVLHALPHLHTLDCSNTHVHTLEAVLVLVHQLTRLHTLRIRHCNLKSDAVRVLVDAQFVLLDVTGNEPPTPTRTRAASTPAPVPPPVPPAWPPRTHVYSRATLLALRDSPLAAAPLPLPYFPDVVAKCA